jgi:hypothetical protein
VLCVEMMPTSPPCAPKLHRRRLRHNLRRQPASLIRRSRPLPHITDVASNARPSDLLHHVLVTYRRHSGWIAPG